MIHPAPYTSWLVIAAPDAGSAFALEWRLAHFGAAAVARHGRWTIELADDGERLDRILDGVRHWLRDRSLRSTSIAVDGIPYGVSLDAAAAAYEAEAVPAREP